jgi:hypothetical protein
MPQLAADDEAIFQSRRSNPETKIRSTGVDQTAGFDHVGNHHRSFLPPVLQSFAVGHPKVPVETVWLALCYVISSTNFGRPPRQVKNED